MLVFFDIDTQRDFLLEDGALYVPGSVRILPTLAKITAFARTKGIKVIASADAHAPDDPEFVANGGQFPPHCVVGTQGQQKVRETSIFGAPIVSPDGVRSSAEGEVVRAARAVVLEKRCLDVFTNPMTSALVSSGDTAVAYGVATDYCVRAAVLGLLARGVSVYLLTDATHGVDREPTEEALREMAEAGSTSMTFEEMARALMDGRLP